MVGVVRQQKCDADMLFLLQVQGDVLVLYVYQLRKEANGAEKVAVEKVSFRKNGGGES